jgi:hypothetical protein
VSFDLKEVPATEAPSKRTHAKDILGHTRKLLIFLHSPAAFRTTTTDLTGRQVRDLVVYHIRAPFRRSLILG